ncbi:MAG: hypothetical protein WCA64_09700 [Gallionella sp.]
MQCDKTTSGAPCSLEKSNLWWRTVKIAFPAVREGVITMPDGSSIPGDIMTAIEGKPVDSVCELAESR